MRTKLGVVILLATTAGTFLNAAEPSVKLRMATLAPKGTSIHQAMLEMAEKWRIIPCGGVGLTIYSDGTMGDEPDIVRRMRIGQLQAGVLTAQGLAEIDNSVTALQNMPMVFRSYEEIDYVRGKLSADIEKKFLEKGYVFLFWSDLGWVRFFSKDPLVRVADLRRVKVFAWAGDNNYLELLKAGGYQPVPLSATDVLLSLQTGMIQAIPTVPLMALAGQYYGTAGHMLDIKWAPLVGGAVMSKKAWDSIPTCAQQSFLESAKAAGEEIKRRARAENDQSVEAMKKRGLVVHALPSDAEAEWRKSVEDLYPKIRGTMVPADMFDRVTAILKEYRATAGKPK